jgi:hypothetical protein
MLVLGAATVLLYSYSTAGLAIQLSTGVVQQEEASSSLRDFLLTFNEDTKENHALAPTDPEEHMARGIEKVAKDARALAKKSCTINFEGIAERRGLQSPDAAGLLADIIAKSTHYHNETDLLVFEHTMKTGGTSFSHELLRVFGRDALLPGSQESATFNKRIYRGSLPSNTSEELYPWWHAKRVMYSHSYFQKGRGDSEFEDWFLTQIPADPVANNGHPLKRVLLLSMWRDPIDWLASHFFEWMCGLSDRVKEAARGLNASFVPPTKTPKDDPSCWGLTNLTVLADYWHQHTLPRKCKEGSMGQMSYCTQFENNGLDPKPHCRSISDFGQSDLFRRKLRDNPMHLVGADPTELELSLETRALRNMGGLQPNNRVTVAWLGLTERYDESLVLFRDWMGLALDPTMFSARKMRYKYCRPTSFWSTDDILMMRQLIGPSVLVHRVAEAILDVRMADFCCRHGQQSQSSSLTERFCT